jgi:uncharacterized protein YqfB (UPF0267 family)
MKKIHTLTESDLEKVVRTVLESFNPKEYEDEDFVEVFVNYFRPWVKKKHGDELGQYPISLLIKNHMKEFAEDYGAADVVTGYYGAYRTMVNVGRELAQKGVHKMPSLKKEGLFLEKYKKAITFFTDRLDLPEWITLNLTEDSPYVVNGFFSVDFDKSIRDKSEKSYRASVLAVEFTETLSNFLGIETGSVTHGKIDLNVSGSFDYHGVDEWVKQTLNKEIKKKIRALPNSEVLHSVKFNTSSSNVGGLINLTFKSSAWRHTSTFTEEVRELIESLGYNTDRLRVMH